MKNIIFYLKKKINFLMHYIYRVLNYFSVSFFLFYEFLSLQKIHQKFNNYKRELWEILYIISLKNKQINQILLKKKII